MLKKISTWSLCILALATVAAAATLDREFNESFEATPGTALRITHGDGDVEIRSWAEDRIEVHVSYHLETRGIGGSRDFEVDFSRKGDTVVVEGRETGSGIFFGSTRNRYRYTVKAPSYVALELHGDDGDISIHGWDASVEIASEDGDVMVDGLTASLDISLDDGDLDLRDCTVDSASVRLEDGDVLLEGGSGSWSVTLDDGNLVARDMVSASFRVRAEDGDVELGFLPSGSLSADIRTDDGDVVLDIPNDASARFSLTVDDGSMTLRANNAVVETRRRHHTTGVLGSGEGLIEVQTSDGDILLRDAD